MAFESLLPTMGAADTSSQFGNNPSRFGRFVASNGNWYQLIVQNGSSVVLDPDFTYDPNNSAVMIVNESTDKGVTWTELPNQFNRSNMPGLGPTYSTIPTQDYWDGIGTPNVTFSDDKITCISIVGVRQGRAYFPFSYFPLKCYQFDCISKTWSFLPDPPVVIHETLWNGGPSYQRGTVNAGLPCISSGPSAGTFIATWLELPATIAHTVSPFQETKYVEFSGGAWGSPSFIPALTLNVDTSGNTIPASDGYRYHPTDIVTGDGGLVRVLIHGVNETFVAVDQVRLSEVTTGFGSNTFSGVTLVADHVWFRDPDNTGSQQNTAMQPAGPAVKFQKGLAKYIAVPLTRLNVISPYAPAYRMCTVAVAVGLDSTTPGWTVYELDSTGIWEPGFVSAFFSTVDYSAMALCTEGPDLLVWWVRALSEDITNSHWGSGEGWFTNSSQIMQAKFNGTGFDTPREFRAIGKDLASKNIVSISAATGGIRSVSTSTPHGFKAGDSIVFYAVDPIFALYGFSGLAVATVPSPTSFTFSDTSTSTATDTSTTGTVQKTNATNTTVYAGISPAGIDSAVLLRIDWKNFTDTWIGTGSTGVPSTMRHVYCKGFLDDANIKGYVAAGGNLIGRGNYIV